MKKSEAIKLIADQLEQYRLILAARPDLADTQSLRSAEGILDLLEGLGMHPPGREPWTGKLLLSWEPEDSP